MSSARPTGPQYVTLVTEGGYRMHATVTLDWEHGAALYRVAELCGTITVAWDSTDYDRNCCDSDAMEVTFGRPSPSPFRWRFEDAPTVYGVMLAGRANFHAERMSPTSPWWLSVRRAVGAADDAEAPDGTRRRTAAIVHTLTHHMLTRPWAAELRRVHDRRHAPARYRRHQEAIRELEAELATLQEKVSTEQAGAAVQAALIAEAATGAGPVAALPAPVAEPQPLAA
ncbi:hypothetical protein ACFQ6N_30565 [Kitasatospora sp. NPDC056446]|uniref:hypothetical protein n=1 Tax=Kitasatospora sp. NPDC056446 TaxID=3345819 RepID=UPI0036BF88D5